MRIRAAAILGFATAAALLGALACGGGGGGPPDLAGTYQLTLGPDPKYTLELEHAASGYAFEIHGASVPIAGTATCHDGRMTMQALVAGFGTLAAEVDVSPDGRALAGTWEIPEVPVSGTMTGTRDPWATWDFAGGIPTFATANCIELDKIQRLSRFRSGAGHDYSDDFESCRSMKHYFHPESAVDMSTIHVFAPFAGTVVGTTEEWDGPTLWKGTAVGIRPEGHPAFHVVLFHVDLHHELAVGDTVVAGQDLGTSEKQTGTAADVAIGVMTPPASGSSRTSRS